jgi:hypothetical protein
VVAALAGVAPEPSEAAASVEVGLVVAASVLLVVAAVHPAAVEEQFDSGLPVVQFVAVVAAALLFVPAFALVGSFLFSYQYYVLAAEAVA